MATTAHYAPRGIDIDFRSDRLPPWLYNEIASLHGQIGRDDNPPKLTCRGNGKPLYVYKAMGRYFVRHFPNGNPEGHDHGVMRRMTDQHRYQAEYGMRAAQAAGYDARMEVSTGHQTRPRRLDVGIYGSVLTGLEIQRSQLTGPQAKRRAADQFAAGWTTAWLSDSEKDPTWTDLVPTARLSVRGWERLPAPNTAKVIISRFRRIRDRSRASGWWYERQPLTVMYDQLAYLMPAGEITPAVIGTRGKVVLAEKAALEVIDSCTYEGASVWDPQRKVDAEFPDRKQHKSLYCHHESEANGAQTQHGIPDILLRPLRELPPARELIAHQSAIKRWMQPQQEGNCAICGHQLWAPQSRQLGLCTRCASESRHEGRNI